MTPAKFRALVFAHAQKAGRHELPWRASLQTGKNANAYRILVSEIMLQQTQVDRVVPHYKAFVKKFPTIRALAHSSLGEVLKSWQGLGYNRRAKMLHEAAKKVVQEFGGKMPKEVETLESLPGIGPYTARAVAAFAYNTDVIFIETNIRTAIIHAFFSPSELKRKHTPRTDMIYHISSISDAQIKEVLEKVYPTGRAREWYGALMDYGAYLKRSGVRLNALTKGYAKQSAFDGSLRQVRGGVLRRLSEGGASHAALKKLFPVERSAQVTASLTALTQEGLIAKKGTTYRLP